MKIVAEKLGLVDMPGTEALMPAELSGGMKKRVALARALALEPKIILYDEPTTGLDPANVRRISALIAKTRQAFHVTSIMVTHDLQAIETITDRVAMLDAGRIIAVGTWKEMEACTTPRVCQFLAGEVEAMSVSKKKKKKKKKKKPRVKEIGSGCDAREQYNSSEPASSWSSAASSSS